MSENSINKARRFLLDKYQLSEVTLQEVKLSAIQDALYIVTDLAGCKIFSFFDESDPHIGASSLIAVPNDNREPYYLDSIGE